MPNTCVAIFSINILFLEICVLDEISLFFIYCISRIEGLSNLYCVIEICTLILFDLVWFPNQVVGVGGAQLHVLKGRDCQVELLERGSPSVCSAVEGSSR